MISKESIEQQITKRIVIDYISGKVLFIDLEDIVDWVYDTIEAEIDKAEDAADISAWEKTTYDYD